MGCWFELTVTHMTYPVGARDASPASRLFLAGVPFTPTLYCFDVFSFPFALAKRALVSLGWRISRACPIVPSSSQFRSGSK